MQGTGTLGLGELIIQQCKMIHADVLITGSDQFLYGQGENSELFISAGQVLEIDASLGLEAFRQVRVVEHRQAIRQRLDHLVQRVRKTVERL